MQIRLTKNIYRICLRDVDPPMVQVEKESFKDFVGRVLNLNRATKFGIQISD